MIVVDHQTEEADGKTKIPCMFYKNFDEHITARYKMKLVGWPLDRFCCPSELSTHVEVDVLRNVFESGATRFERMTALADEWKEWDKKRFESALEQTTGYQQSSEPAIASETPSQVCAVLSPMSAQQPMPTTAMPSPSQSSLTQTDLASNSAQEASATPVPASFQLRRMALIPTQDTLSTAPKLPAKRARGRK
ncbi:hypothetical protein VKT23_019456 [Stygiomarasmius scandens]|uniref:Uncharacterized protein n=1 Tax=Marasmiellus scandens TaxID=2682957 RepID=A0ABR1IL99_9AGAR